MSRLPLGRLFWKFLIFFFLAQTTTVLGIGLAIWAIKPDQRMEPPPPGFETGRPVGEFNRPPPFTPPSSSTSGTDGARPPLPQRTPGPPIIHLLAGAIVSLIFAALLAAYVARPIRRLRLALQDAAKGTLTPGLSADMGHRRDELADLGKDFDRMAQHLALLMEGQRRLLHDVSHELRSPLARLNAIIGLARQQPENLDDYLSMLERESMRMDRLVSELLTLSRLESGMVEETNEAIDVSTLLHDVVADAQPEIDQAGCRIEMNDAGGALINGDPELLHRVFDNLLRNALAYASSGKWVGITQTATSNEVIVRIEDRGPGVLSSDLDRLFVPFFRGAGSAGKDGHGLGLAIARQIIDKHHGQIEAANRTEGGLRLTVSLPRTSPNEKT